MVAVKIRAAEAAEAQIILITELEGMEVSRAEAAEVVMLMKEPAVLMVMEEMVNS